MDTIEEGMISLLFEQSLLAGENLSRTVRTIHLVSPVLSVREKWKILTYAMSILKS